MTKIVHSSNKNSLFLGLMGSPFKSDWTTSMFRIASSVLKQGHQVTIWTCGYSTQLTQKTNIRVADPIHPSATEQNCNYSLTELALSLIKTYPKQLHWYVCQYCMEERGATNQIPEVEVRLPFSFNTYLKLSEKRLITGIK